MIRLADRYPQAHNIYISTICNGPSTSYGARMPNFIKEQSEQGRQVCNGRPWDCHTEPVGLYHPVFNEFHDTMESTEPFYADAATYDATDRIFYVFSNLYRGKNKRASAIEEPLRIFLGRAFTLTRANKVESDGVTIQSYGQSTVYLMIHELKNEIGDGGSSLTTKAILPIKDTGVLVS